MITILIVFVLITLGEAGYLYFWWDKISLFVDIGTEVHKVGVKSNEKYSNVVKIAGTFLKRFKGLLWIPAGIALFINFILALVLGGILSFIIGIFS